MENRLTNEQIQQLIILSNKVPTNGTYIIKLGNKYYKIKELG